MNHKALGIITDDAAYWIGFLFADGSACRQRKGSPIVQLRLSEVDRSQIIKLREFLGSTHAVGTCPPGNFGGYKSRASVRLAVVSERLANRLLDLGRYEGAIASELVTSCHFWRGDVDGDGSVFISKMPYEGDLPGVSRSSIYDITGLGNRSLVPIQFGARGGPL